MTKELVRKTWDDNATRIIKAGGIVEDKWTQDVCGVITLQTVLDIQKTDAKDIPGMVEACAYGSNSSARKQALFSEKKTKATALANELVKLVK